VSFSDPKDVATDLRDRLQAEAPSLVRLLVAFGAFAERGGIIVPEMWHVTNVQGVNQQTGVYDPPTGSFSVSERILGFALKDVLPKELRTYLADRACVHDPFWFHDCIELLVYNTLEDRVRAAFRKMHEDGKLHPPQTLEEWERHARMWVLLFGAYFEAFGEPGKKYVGNGADVLSIPWPI